MDRRHLLATLAIVAMYASLSHGFRSLERSPAAKQRLHDLTLAVRDTIASASNLRTEIVALLHGTVLPQSQWYAEAELPPPPPPQEAVEVMAAAQADAASQIARVQVDKALEKSSSCAQARAARATQRAQREAMKWQEFSRKWQRDTVKWQQNWNQKWESKWQHKLPTPGAHAMWVNVTTPDTVHVKTAALQ